MTVASERRGRLDGLGQQILTHLLTRTMKEFAPVTETVKRVIRQDEVGLWTTLRPSPRSGLTLNPSLSTQRFSKLRAHPEIWRNILPKRRGKDVGSQPCGIPVKPPPHYTSVSQSVSQ